MRILSRGAINVTASETARIAQSDQILIVSGAQSGRHPAIADTIHNLQKQFTCRHYVVEAWLATIEEYENYQKIHQDFSPGCIIAIGGGRVMDFAKLIGTKYSADEIRQRHKNKEAILRTIPLIAVPTTAGSGAEATPFAVFYFANEKSTVTDPSFLPDTEIIDPDLLSSLSRKQLAISGADAICQSIESIFSPDITSQSLLISKTAFTAGISALKRCVNGELPVFDELLCLASNLAGQAITMVRTNVPHALSYYLTSHYDIPHGQAVSFYIGAYLEDAVEKVKTLHSISRPELVETCKALELALNIQNGQSFESAWHDFMQEIGLSPYFIHEDAEQIREDILQSANIERLNNLIVPLDIRKIVEKSIRSH